MIRALLFDLYDTLAVIDTKIYRAVKAEMATRSGLPVNEFLMTWKKYTQPSARGELLTAEERVARVINDLGGIPEIRLVQQIASLEYELQMKKVALFDTVYETLEYCKQSGVKIGLVTNAPNTTRSVPNILGIERFFDVLVFSFSVGVLKPDSRIYLVACEKLEVKPSECIFIGDGNDRELDGAKSLGMTTVMIDQSRNELLRHEQSQSYDYRIQIMSELNGIVERLI